MLTARRLARLLALPRRRSRSVHGWRGPDDGDSVADQIRERVIPHPAPREAMPRYAEPAKKRSVR